MMCAHKGVDEVGRPWDFATASVIGVGCILLILGNVVLVRNRNYAPIRLRGVTLTVLSSVGGLIWIAAELVVQKHFDRSWSHVLKNCSLWTFWMQACFGFGLFLNCLTVRMFQLHHVLVRKLGIPKKYFHLKMTIAPLLVLLAPTIIVCILASILKAARWGKSDNFKDCTIKMEAFKILLLLLLPAYFIIFFFFAVALRNVMSQWNEFRQIRIGGIMSLFLFLLSVVTLITRTDERVLGRCFLSFAVAGAVFYYFWSRNWEIIYNVIFHKAEYEDRFGNELNRFEEGVSSRSHRRQDADPMNKIVLKMQDEARRKREIQEALQEEIKLLQHELDQQTVV